jgi:hypothetical protein
LSYDGAELFPRRLLFQSFPPFTINITYCDKFSRLSIMYIIVPEDELPPGDGVVERGFTAN